VIVPWLWWFEVRNILVVNERRGRISERETAVFLRQLARLRVRVDPAPGEDEVLRLARMHGLSVYDSAYLELAQRERVALATLDQRLRSAALAEGVGLVGGVRP
jgi:predicted nucleic acid-binding protein